MVHRGYPLSNVSQPNLQKFPIHMKDSIIPQTIEEVEQQRKERSAQWEALKVGLNERVREYRELCKQRGSEERLGQLSVEILRYREEIACCEEGIVKLDHVRVSLERQELAAA